MRNFIICLLFSVFSITHAKTLVISIGLECNGCDLGLLKGVNADLRFFDELAKKMNADRVITINEAK